MPSAPRPCTVPAEGFPAGLGHPLEAASAPEPLLAHTAPPPPIPPPSSPRCHPGAGLGTAPTAALRGPATAPTPPPRLPGAPAAAPRLRGLRRRRAPGAEPRPSAPLTARPLPPPPHLLSAARGAPPPPLGPGRGRAARRSGGGQRPLNPAPPLQVATRLVNGLKARLAVGWCRVNHARGG